MEPYKVSIGFTKRQVRSFEIEADSPESAEDLVLAALAAGDDITPTKVGPWHEDPDLYVVDVERT